MKNQIPFKFHYLIFFLFTISFSCKKDSFLDAVLTKESGKNEVVEKFLRIPQGIDSRLQRIVDALRLNDQKNSIIESLANKEGLPQWEHVEFTIVINSRKEIASNSTNYRTANTSNASDTFCLVPLVLNDKKSVNSFIACKLDSAISFQLYERDNYDKFGYKAAKNKPSANEIVKKFLSLDHRVFGYTMFGVLDTALNFYRPKPKKGFVYYSLNYKSNQSLGSLGIGDACEEEAWFYNDGSGNVTQVTNWEDVGGPCLFGPIPWIEPFSGIAPGSNWGDPTFWGGGGVGNQGGLPININGYYLTQIAILKNEINANPYNPIPCQYLQQFYSLGNYKAPQSVVNKVNSLYTQYAPYGLIPTWLNSSYGIWPSGVASIQNILDAKGSVVNCDYFPVHITQLPSINGNVVTPDQLFEYFRLNINSFINNSKATFSPYVDNFVDETSLWNSSNPLGAILHLNMINDGSVVVSDFSNSSPFINGAHFTVSTLKTELDGAHPVSGNRRFGIQVDNVNGGYNFYVTAVDRITTSFFDFGNDVLGALGFSTGFDQADALWRSFQTKMIDFVKSNGGDAKLYTGTPDITERPKFNAIKAFLQNPNMTLAELKILMGC